MLQTLQGMVILNQHGAQIKCLWSDRGEEYRSDEYSEHLKKAGTVRKLVVHDTPEHNRVAERLNCTLLEKVRAMLHDSGLPKFLWAEATAHKVYLKNRTWTCTIGNTTPYELLNGHKLNIKNLHPWGCKVHVHNNSEFKLDGRSKVGHWMGYDEETKDSHQIYWPERCTISIERSVKFNLDDEVVVGVLLLEGEKGTENDEVEHPTATEAEKHDVDIETPDAENPVTIPEATEGRRKCIRKESKYVRMLKEGSAVIGRRAGGTLPKGMQHGSTVNKEIKHATAIGLELEINYAMATVLCETRRVVKSDLK